MRVDLTISEEQRNRICTVFFREAGLKHLWGPEGPQERAALLLSQKEITLSQDQMVLVRVAWLIWRAPYDVTQLKAAEMLFDLSEDRLHLVGSLFVALAAGSFAVGEWLLKHED